MCIYVLFYWSSFRVVGYSIPHPLTLIVITVLTFLLLLAVLLSNSIRRKQVAKDVIISNIREEVVYGVMHFILITFL